MNALTQTPPMGSLSIPTAKYEAHLHIPSTEPRLVLEERRPVEDAARRALNVLASAVGLLVAMPIMALIALAIYLVSPGPVIYTQIRVGIDQRGRGRARGQSRRVNDIGGKPFTIYKFRTMRLDAETGTGAVWAKRGDDRVLPYIGRALRLSRLDELPQLWNVLKGDMNLVGPRPERPVIVAQLRRQIPHYTLRQRARPGITGWAQINQHYDSCLDDVRRKVAYDLEYLKRQSAWEDLKIMARTVPVMVLRKGAS